MNYQIQLFVDLPSTVTVRHAQAGNGVSEAHDWIRSLGIDWKVEYDGSMMNGVALVSPVLSGKTSIAPVLAALASNGARVVDSRFSERPMCQKCRILGRVCELCAANG